MKIKKQCKCPSVGECRNTVAPDKHYITFPITSQAAHMNTGKSQKCKSGGGQGGKLQYDMDSLMPFT